MGFGRCTFFCFKIPLGLIVLAQNEPYKFSHLLFLTRVYHLTPDEESALFNSSDPSTLKNKGKTAKKARPAFEPQAPTPQDGIYVFHPEDEIIKEVSDIE
jgi:protein BCP1